MKAIRVVETGGPEKLLYQDVPDPKPGPGQARVKVEAIGLNFIDVYHRTGLYPVPLPFTPGMEAAGVVDAVGIDAAGLQIGDRMAFAMNLGAYAEFVLVPAPLLVRLPREVGFREAAASMLQGMTAHYLTHSTFPLAAGMTVLVHAAAGGTGLLIIQLAKQKGTAVIGTVSSPAKAELARKAGADHVILYTQTDFESEVRSITEGRGVDVVYDSVGKTTFAKSMNCLRKRGMLVLFGQSSGPVAPLDPTILNAKGSIYLTRPSLAHYATPPDELQWRSRDILSGISSGSLKIRIGESFPLSAAAAAHQALEGRKTTGKVLLIPGE